jgi:LmbE family N-acetylglucosaminyl deacetylase
MKDNKKIKIYWSPYNNDKHYDWGILHYDPENLFERFKKNIDRKSFKEFWCMDQTPYNLHYNNFKANLYVDITEHLEQKQQALRCYKSYFSEQNIEQIINYNRYRGSFLGENKIAETFSIQYQLIA